MMNNEEKNTTEPSTKNSFDYNAFSQAYVSNKKSPALEKKKKRTVKVLTLIFSCICCLIVGVFLGIILISYFPLELKQEAGQIVEQKPSKTVEEILAPTPTPFLRTPVPKVSQRPVPTLGSPTIEYIEPSFDSSKLAELVRPSVVGIITKQAETQKAADQSDVTFEVEQGTGSGIILSAEGYVVTNYHVLQTGELIYVTLYTGEEIKAELIGTDPFNDLAVLKIDYPNLKPIAIGDSQTVKVGEKAVAIGNPMGIVGGTITQGVVSAVDREVFIESENATRVLIQTDAAINPGNSGGALVNAQGLLIGINTLKSVIAGFDSNGVPITAEGIGYAIPVHTVMPVVYQLIEYGRIEKPGIGIVGTETNDNFTKINGVPGGILIIDVVSGGPADKAGLKIEDIILSVDGVAVQKMDELVAFIATKKIGTTIQFLVYRNGEQVTIPVVVADRNDMK